MNAVEIEAAVSELAAEPFDAKEFPFRFLAAYDNKETTLSKLRAGPTNKSDVEGGVLQRNNVHILVTEPGKVSAGLVKLKLSAATTKHKCAFVVATDGETFEAEHLSSGETVACEYSQFPDHFGFFLPLAGITTVRSIRENAFDIKAVGRLNRLYLELLRENPEWKEGDLRHEMNRFLVRLVFCFYAEDTRIFATPQMFSNTVEQMSDRDAANTHEVIAEIFRAMSLNTADRSSEEPLPRWASKFPYVNGGLFSNAGNVPKFSRVARSYLMQIADLDWKLVNPDIFGSMIQGVANDSERANLGMHYTSVPNILRVLNPLFLDDIRRQLKESRGNPRKLLNLKKRLAHIRVFDPACGSGNFLITAYKQLREIEHEINVERNEPDTPSCIPITNFRGIEIQDFCAEVARLSLVIAEFQCNSIYLGSDLAINVFLPLSKKNWIISGNALRLNWQDICPPEGTGVKVTADDLFSTPLVQAEIDFENAGGETYICGNPPYVGADKLGDDQIIDMDGIFKGITKKYRKLDYVSGWFLKAADYCRNSNAVAAFVSTNSICQGQQVELLWPLVLKDGIEILFARTSFKWSNLAAHNAGVTVIVVGIGKKSLAGEKVIFTELKDGSVEAKNVNNINAYLEAGANVIVKPLSAPISEQSAMQMGNKATDGGNLLLTPSELQNLNLDPFASAKLIRRIYGSAEFIKGTVRYCLWIEDDDLPLAMSIPKIAERIERCRAFREKSSAPKLAQRSHQFREMNVSKKWTIIVPSVSKEKRPYLPCGILDNRSIVSNLAFALYDAPLWNLALIASRLHLVWVKTVCGKMKTDFRYSNTLGWHTFPIPKLTEKNKADLTHAAEKILEARERHFPATIADLYDSMPDDLRAAHEWNDEVVERILIGRKFKNDSERLEKLYEMYAKLSQKTTK